MRISGVCSVVAAVALSLMPCIPAPACADEIAWLAGDTVQVSAHRFDPITGAPTENPLMAYLARPEASGRHPAMIELHGCGGFRTRDVAAADVLKSFGYTTLALDSLGDFDACSSGDSGALAEAFDAYAALDWLAAQSYVDPSRIALIGFSLGGIAVLSAVEPGPLEKVHQKRFQAAIAFYPNCRYHAGVMTAPTLILVGDKDDWTLARWCQEMVARRDGKGPPVTLIVYPGATHAFDYPAPPHEYRGHHLEYDAKATADAWTQVRSFLHATLDAPEPGSLSDHGKGN